MVHEGQGVSEDVAGARIGRRELVLASAGMMAVGFIGPMSAMAQSATPGAEAEADPVADPEPDPEAGEGASPGAGDFTLYSGRNETLVGLLVEQYAEDMGTMVDVRYGGTGELAATIL